MLLDNGLLVALADSGWEVTAGLAQPVTCRRGSDELQPASVVGELYANELDADTWATRARELGIADLSLAPREPAVATSG